jgi:tryptophan-rich hypothetical protein
MPRRVSPKKLLDSKWTATTPRDQDKHFVVVGLEADPADPQRLLRIELEAVLTRRRWTIEWRELNDALTWTRGWR